ncbi:MAG: hypothetical protein ABI610_08880 [Acidobacteriota bacterium]
MTAAIFLFAFAPSAQAQKDALQEGDRVMALLGEAREAQFIARCPPGKHVAGFDLQTGVGVSAIRPICVTALAPAVAGPFEPYSSSFGGRGGRGSSSLRLVCPSDIPVVTKMTVELENAWVNGIVLYCGLVDRPQSRHVYGTGFLGRLKSENQGGGLVGGLNSLAAYTQRWGAIFGNNTCADNLVAVGISGRASTRLDAVGLICGEPTLTAGATVKAQGRVRLAAEAAADRRPLTICDAWRAARSRNSPAAPGLEARCKAEGEQPPIDFDGLAVKGEAIASQDPLSAELRNQQAEGPARTGFDIGMAVAEGQTAPGPGKQAIQNRLSPAEQAGFVFALAFSLDRNRNADLARKGAAVAEANPVVAAARRAEPDVLHRLGFDIATGHFGDSALGADGNTAPGPGSRAIRNALSPSVQSGFDDGEAFHLRPK